MPAFPQPPFGRRPWRRSLFVLAALSLLGGCANGDFGEVRPLLVSDNVHDWMGPAAVAGRGTPSIYELTDDERELRDLAYPLIEPPYDRQRWYSILGEYGLRGDYRRATADRTAYAVRLLSDRHRSPSTLYSRLIDDIRNDITRMPQFFETAARVIDVDQKRRKSLAYISQLSRMERENALRRIRENTLIVAWVRDSISDRAASYRFALERLVISTPSQEAASVEHTLNQLEAENERYRHGLPPARGPRLVTAY
jgi:hypothetical protein